MDLSINLTNDPEATLLTEKTLNSEQRTKLDVEIRELYKRIRELESTQTELKNINFDLDVKLYDVRKRKKEEARQAELREQEKQQARAIEDTVAEIRRLTSDFPTIDKLHEYQLEDVVSTIQAYRAGKRGMLNANDMGMGKTVETVVILYVLTKLMELSIGRRPSVLWLTKKSLMQKSSPKEVKRWNPECSVVTPATAKNLQDREFYLEMYEYTGADIFMANYEFVRTTPKCLDIKWDIVVIDEVHKLKGGANASGPTKIWETIKNLCLKSRFVLMLSGTPMVNAPEEMWSYLHIFNPEKFPDIKRFRKDFMDYKKAADGILSGVLEVKPDLIMKHALKGQMIRRSAEEVGLQLPELTYEIIELEMTPAQQEAYNMMEKRFFVWLDENEDKPLTAMAIVAQLTRLRQINLWPVIDFEIKDSEGVGTGNYETLDIRESSKIDEAMDIIENVQQQVVIASTFNEPLFEIERRCQSIGLKAGVIYGGSKLEDGLEEKFQQGHLDVLLLNSAMGEGLNLQKNPKAWPGGASYGILLDRWWSPMRNDQVVKRIYRQGSNIPVFWYELQNVPSVDQFIHAKNDEKNESFASIMTSKEIRPGGEWKNYLKEMFKK